MSPVKRLGVSGGTAPFFSLSLAPEHRTPDRPVDFFIGKDLSRAEGEAVVYEEMLSLLSAAKLGDDPNGLKDLLEFTLQYQGIFTVQEDLGSEEPGEKEPQEQPSLDLLVLKNLRCGCEKLRLLDIKMGERTASAGWQGKSSSAATRQAFVDSLTNSAAEGFRVEGFDGAPESIRSMNPMLDIPNSLRVLVRSDSKVEKKARRLLVQRLSAADVMSHYLRLSERGSVELQEIVMHETVSRVVALAIACRKVQRHGRERLSRSVAVFSLYFQEMPLR